MRFLAGVGAIVALGLLSPECRASDIFSPIPLAQQSEGNFRPNSVFVFAGRMSATDTFSTLIFNLNQPNSEIHYDNYIVGVAYGRDMLDLGYGFTVGAEIGAADRFGHYRICCERPILSVSDGVIQSGEFWGGASLRYEGIKLFDQIRLSPAVTGGLSAITNSIGAERQREIILNGNAHLLFYLGAEISLSMPSSPLELVFRLHHRSGADGTLGNLMEGYNATVAGLRYRF